MGKLFAALFFPFFFSANILFSQSICDTSKVSAILAQARAAFLGDQFHEAPNAALSALPILEKCEKKHAIQSDIYKQAAEWFTELETFEKAAECLQKALDLAENDLQKARVLSDWAELDIASRQFEQAKLHLKDAKEMATGPLQTQILIREATIETELNHSAAALAILESLKSRFAANPEAGSVLALQFYVAHISALASVAKYSSVFEVVDGYLASSANTSSEHLGSYIELLLLAENCANASSASRKKAPEYIEKLEMTLAKAAPFVQERFEAVITASKILFYTYQFQHPKGLTAFDQAIGQLKKARLSHRLLEAKAYQNVANAYIGMNLNQKGIEMSRSSNALLDKIPNPSQRLIGLNYFRIGQCYRNLDEFDLALEYLNRSFDIMVTSLAPESQLPFLVPLINVYGEKKDTLHTRLLIERYESIIAVSPSTSDLDKFILGKYWFFYYKDFGALETAIAYAEAALRDYGAKVSNFYSKEFELRLSHAYVQAGDYRKSFELAKQLADYFEQRRAKLGEAYGTEHYSWMLAVSALSAWRLYESSGDTSMRRLAYEQCEKSENALYYLRRQKKTNQDIQWITDAYLYSGLVNLRYHFYKETGDYKQVAKAFELGEMSRMARFQEYLNTANAIQFGDLSPEASQQERQMLGQIANIKSEQDKLYFQSDLQKDSIQNALANNLTELQRRYNQLLSTFEGQFPSYYRLKYDLSHLDLETVQHKVLKPNETLLCYYYYSNEIGIMAVRSDSVLFTTIPFADRTLYKVDSLIKWFADFPLYQKLPEAKYAAHQVEFAQALHDCYEKLIAPVAPFLTSELLIEPCEKLVYLPFEALLSSPATNLGRPASWPYWANNKNISYIQSATVFDAVQRRKPLQEPKNEVYSFAPFFDGDTAAFAGLDYTRRFKADFYSPLPHTGEEAVAVANLLHGKAFIGKDASAERFNEKAGECKILHAATHASGGNGNQEPSFLALQAEEGNAKNSLLFTDQIYQLQLNADLVTLSACESGLGGYSSNEGLVGLTRAFTCAGARNVVASLWSVNDASTQRLMVLFYKEIKKGEPYSRALANAKRAFVKENRQYAHPYYWAGFVLNGR